jgi:hypothetical protein
MRGARNISRALMACLVAPLAYAADTEKLHGFGLAETATTPAYGRVLIAFLLVAALAWGSVWLMRRYGLRVPLGALGAGTGTGTGTGTQVRHLARSTLPGGIACHVIETQGQQVLITVTRNGVSSLVLGAAPSPTAPGAATP